MAPAVPGRPPTEVPFSVPPSPDPLHAEHLGSHPLLALALDHRPGGNRWVPAVHGGQDGGTGLAVPQNTLGMVAVPAASSVGPCVGSLGVS